MRWLPLALALVSGSASADPKLVRATGRLDGKTARLTARYTVSVTGGTSSTSNARFDLPSGAIVTGAKATLGGAAHSLALIGKEDAQNRFSALSGDEVKPGPKTSAVWIETTPGGVDVTVVTPLLGTMAVDLEMSAPTCFHREIRYVAMPKGWDAVAGAVPNKRLHERAAIDEACGSLGEDFSHWVGFATGDVAKLSGPRIGITGDRVDLGEDSIVRVEVNLANVLADVPRDLATVIVVDGSRSMSDAQLEAQRDTIRAYLKSAPNSRVQVAAFARYAKPLLRDWMAATPARARVDAALEKLVLENGSNLDVGLGEASNWLARTKGTKRIVLITDELLAKRLQQLPAAALKQAVPAGTLVHVVVADDSTTLYRDDDAKLAKFAAATEGMLVRGGSDADDRPIDATRLVRPIELEYLKLSAPGWKQISNDEGEPQCNEDATLAQGQACMWWGEARRDAAKPITVAGKLWGKAITHVVTPSVTQSLDFVRELSWHGGLSDEQRKQLDERARGVNDKWSLYVAWGGPGTYEITSGGTGWGAVCGCGAPGGIGHGSGTGTYTTSTNRAQVPLEEQLADELATCRLGSERVTVEVELTVQEIADVHVKAKTAQGAEKHRIEQCVAEVVWGSAPVIVKPRDYQVMTFVAGG